MKEIRIHRDDPYRSIELQTDTMPSKLIAAVFHRENEVHRLNLAEAEIYANLFAAAPETKRQRDALLKASKWLLDEVDTIFYPIDSEKLIYKAKLRTAITAIEFVEKESGK